MLTALGDIVVFVSQYLSFFLTKGLSKIVSYCYI